MIRKKLNKKEVWITLLLTGMLFISTIVITYMGEYRPGAVDDDIPALETGVSSGECSEADIWAIAIENGFSSAGLQRLLNDGYLRGYMDEMKARGMIPQDFSIGGSNSSSGGGSNAGNSGSGGSSSGSSSSTKKHTHSYEEKVTKETTCTEEGEKTFTCSCGKTYTEAIPATGHFYEITDSRDVSCAEDGYVTYTCSVCGDTYTDTTDALGHNYELKKTEPPTCEENGYEEYTCSICGDTYQDILEKTGHNPGDWKKTKKSSFFKEGEDSLYCSTCGDVIETRSVPQTCPLPLWGVILIVVGVVVIIAGVIVVIVLKKKRRLKL